MANESISMREPDDENESGSPREPPYWNESE